MVAQNRITEVTFPKEPTFEGQQVIAKNHNSGSLYTKKVNTIIQEFQKHYYLQNIVVHSKDNAMINIYHV